MMNVLTPAQTSTIATTEVSNALNAILSTDKFMASPQMSAFLRYVVEQTLIGNTRRIKAFTVGIEALGKPASFDPQTDPSVRVLAKRLRSSLDTYYQQNPDTDIFIEMKPGSYVPKFLRRSEMPVEIPAAVSPMQAPEHSDDFVTEQASAVSSELATNPPHASNQQPVGDARPQQETAQSAAPGGYQAHLQVQQSASKSDNTAFTEGDSSETSEDRAARKSGISQLWRAYKSATKVA